MRTRNRNSGILALGVLGLYYLYRNRDRIEQFLDRQGIEVDTSNIRSRLREGASSVVDRIRSQGRQLADEVDETVAETEDQLRKAG
jgi:hypothetical protein